MKNKSFITEIERNFKEWVRSLKDQDYRNFRFTIAEKNRELGNFRPPTEQCEQLQLKKERFIDSIGMSFPYAHV